ncbi:hypothetical protein ACSIGC_08120 [Tenacibaculum sp. ZS6-P6]|uniref:hypothetical protein n=1 Tax=Tenacibaculum sp. ZS6-P6 TaxID=3447503 RepID=UPI003F9ACF3A
MIFKKKKRNPSLIIPVSSVSEKKKTSSNSLGIEMKPFHRDNDLNVTKHDKLVRQVESKLPLTIKGVRRFPVEVVKQDITNLCEKALHQIQADLGTVRLVVAQGQSKFKHRLANFDKEALKQKYKEEHLQKHSGALQEKRNKLTEYVEAQKAKRHLILEQLNQLKHETHDYLFEKCKGEAPKKSWYNA